MITITQGVVDKINEMLDHGLVHGLGEPKAGKMCVEAAICYALGLPHGDDPKCVLPVLRSLKISLNDREWSSNKARAEGLRRLAIAQLGSDSLDTKDFVTRLARMTIQTMVPSALRSAAKLLTGEHPTKLLVLASKCEAEPTEANAREAETAAANAANAANAAYAANATAAAANAAAYANAANAAAAPAYATAAAAYASYAANAAAYAAAYAANATANAAYAAANASYAAYAANAAANAAAYAAAAKDTVLAAFAENVVGILIAMDAPGCKWLEVARA